jgi:hypothetical protein
MAKFALTFIQFPKGGYTLNTSSQERDQPWGLRRIFQYAAVYTGVAASVGVGVTACTSEASTTAAIVMGTSYGIAYLLKK